MNVAQNPSKIISRYLATDKKNLQYLKVLNVMQVVSTITEQEFILVKIMENWWNFRNAYIMDP